MIRSMTGFGAAEGTVGSARVTVELRSVNHRFFNATIKLPAELSRWEGEVREALRDQVVGTVRWTDCMQRLIDLGCDFFIELGPGNVLAGLLKRTNRNIPVISIGDAESVGKCGAAL